MRRVSPLLRPSRFWPWAVARLWRVDTIQIGHCAIECALFCYFNRSIARSIDLPQQNQVRAAIKEIACRD